jgi:anaerobic ribonucleoside-triphosphate reductase
MSNCGTYSFGIRIWAFDIAHAERQSVHLLSSARFCWFLPPICTIMPRFLPGVQKNMTRRDLKDSTDITLFVRTSGDDVVQWNRQKIIDALMLETYVDLDTARAVSIEVEKQIFASGIDTLTAPLIRELVNAKLIERGLEEARRMHTRLGFPIYDIGHLIVHRNKENANIPHWPEGTNLTLACGIKRQYALHNVFSREVAEAHLSGDLHLHDMGYIDRPYCSRQSLEYIKKFGLNLPNIPSFAKPARHAEVLLAHMVRFSAALQGNFSGAIEWDALNLFFAPYLTEMSDTEIKQLAQLLVFEFSQLAFARGGQVMYTGMSLYWDIPDLFEKTPAIGPGGEYTGKTYGEYTKDAQRFASAILDVFLEGDATGRPFSFPRPLIHIGEKFFRTPGHEDFLLHACRAASEKGSPFFVFDREVVRKEDRDDAKTPWKMRNAAIHSVTLNLPRLGYRAEGDDAKLFSLLSRLMDLAAGAHGQKKKYIEELLNDGEEGPLSFLLMNQDGLPYLRPERSTYLIGMVGLSELVNIHTNAPFGSKAGFDFGLKVVRHMKTIAEKLGKKYGMKLLPAQVPAETTSYRFARLDLKGFSPKAARYIKGDLLSGGLYYTNSTLIDISAPLAPLERIRIEGCIHALTAGGALTQIWTGEHTPSAHALARLVAEAFRKTKSKQITFSPDFTGCGVCRKVSRGLLDACAFCGSGNVDGITKVTGYYARVSGLNKGKLSELRDLHRSDIAPTD